MTSATCRVSEFGLAIEAAAAIVSGFNTSRPLREAPVEALRPLVDAAGGTLPPVVRVSCGFPSRAALSAARRRIGECWAKSASPAGEPEVFISPVLADPIEVLGVVAHELVHAGLPPWTGHRGRFPKVARALGLEAPMTATTVGPELRAKLAAILERIGAYPHKGLVAGSGRKTDRCRLVKASCPECGYVIRTTRKWIDDVGLPTCPCGSEFEEAGS